MHISSEIIELIVQMFTAGYIKWPYINTLKPNVCYDTHLKDVFKSDTPSMTESRRPQYHRRTKPKHSWVQMNIVVTKLPKITELKQHRIKTTVSVFIYRPAWDVTIRRADHLIHTHPPS